MRMGSIGVALVALAAARLSTPQQPPPDPLAAFGIHVTTGAAAGYIEDKVCATCHLELYRSYQQVGMARSFFRPAREKTIEDFGKEIVHAPSKQIFEMVWRDDRLVFRRYQRDTHGDRINLFEQPVDWILGSGNHARVYLYQTAEGELYQLPIAWYSQTSSWGMAPGYDRPDHDGVMRRVRHECMFCHNAYPEIAPSADGYWRSQALPKNLPEGTGCQRCHGPGATHARAMFARKPEQAAATIVNPFRLSLPRRNDICYECHLLPSVAVQGVRRFGRDIYSFRPGEALSEYEVLLDVTPSKDRFEIAQQAYRLQQSLCFRMSNGRLNCLHCHDPHGRIAPPDRPAHIRTVCLGCHEANLCSGQQHAAGGRDNADCAACHMPKRRTRDVVHVVMTDHRISRGPFGQELLAPLEEKDPIIENVEFFDASTAPKGAEGELFRLLPFLRGGSEDPRIVARFTEAFAASGPKDLEPLFDRANAEAKQRQWSKLLATCATILERAPSHPLAFAWLGLGHEGLGNKKEAVDSLRRAVMLAPDRAGLHVRLGLALLANGNDEDAIAELERATTLRPNLAAAWLTLGKIRARRNENAAAADAFRRTLALEPSDTGAYIGLGRALAALGDEKGAAGVWEHALIAASNRRAIEKAMP